MKSALSAVLSVVAVTFSLVGGVYAADLAKGEQLSQTCMGCHGVPGLHNPSPVYNVPMIGGQNAEYIVLALQAYRSKERPHPTMRAQAASLSDDDMKNIAAYFAQFEGNPRPSPATASLIEKGKELVGVCATCHGKNGSEPTVADYPMLAGQYQDYLVYALREYRSGARKNALMNGQARSLTLDDIKALSAYFASQSGGLSAPEVSSFK